MESSNLLRQLLRYPSVSLHLLSTPFRARPRTIALFSSSLRTSSHRFISSESLPRVIQPSVWHSIVPKFLRRSNTAPMASKPKSQEWNPATPFIILGLLIGSQAIQTLWLKKDMATFSRRAEAKIGILREVIERVQKGEEVDVEGMLGTGDPGMEKEWEEVLKEIEEEEILFRSKKRRRAIREAAKEEEERDKAEQNAAKELYKTEAHGKAKFF